MSAEIFDSTGISAELVDGGGGIFDVKLDGELVFSKFESNRFPKTGEIAAILKQE